MSDARDLAEAFWNAIWDESDYDQTIDMIVSHDADVRRKALASAAKHFPMLAFMGAYAWIYCGCGFNEEYGNHTANPSDWTEHIRSLIDKE